MITSGLLASGLAAIAIPIIIEILKKWYDVRWAPVAAFVLGILFGIGDFYLTGGDLIQTIILGISVGGTSTGLYSIIKTTVLGR